MRDGHGVQALLKEKVMKDMVDRGRSKKKKILLSLSLFVHEINKLGAPK